MKKTSLFVFVLVFLFSCNKPKLNLDSDNPVDPAYDTKVVATEWLKGLDTPWEIAFAPDGRIFFTERSGRVQVFTNGVLETWLDLSNIVEQGESGLLGIAVDPNFSQNGYIYIAYTYSTPAYRYNNRLVRCKENPVTKKGSEDLILIDGIRGNNNHNGGPLKFGPDGKMYWTVGDRFEPNTAQDLTNLNGKILRLNTDGSVPTDNPFTNSYIWTYGHRNVQGLAWQNETNLLFATEHGPSSTQGCCNDEINVIEKGKNYGWPIIQGMQTQNGLVTPIFFSGTTVTWAPAGAIFVKNGKWKNSFVFVGLAGQALYRAVFDTNNNRKVLRVEEHLKNTYGRLRDIAEAPDGTLYLCVSNRDGRGTPRADDDQILKLKIE